MNADPDWSPEVDRLRTQLWALELRFAWFRLYVISAACTALTIAILGARIILSLIVAAFAAPARARP